MRNSSVRTAGRDGLCRHRRPRGSHSTLPRLTLALLAYIALLLSPFAACRTDGKQEPSGSAAAPAAEQAGTAEAIGKTEKTESASEIVRPGQDGVGGAPQAGGEPADAAATKTENGAPAPAGGEKPAVKKEVTVDGEVPGPMLGRWLVLTTLNLPDGPSPNASLLEVTLGADGKINFEHRTRDLPADVLDAAKAAGKAGKDFTPTQEQLRKLDASWSTFPTDVEAPPVRGLKYWFVARDHYTDEFKTDEGARDAKATLIVSRFPIAPPGGRAPTRTDLFFFIKDLTPERLTGPYTSFQLVAGFAPVPVTLQGGFTAYRVGSAPATGSTQAPPAAPATPSQPKSSG